MAAGICAAVCAFLGIIGNSVVLSALIWGPSKELKKHPTMPLFVSLAVSDLIFSIVNLPITAARSVRVKLKFKQQEQHKK